MKVREIKKEDIKVGVKVIHKVDYNKGGFNTDIIRRIFRDRVFYETNVWDFINSVKKNYLLVEEEPTGIPTFDGDISKQVGGDHYSKNDPIQFAKDNYPPEHLEGFYRINVDKYMARYDKKNGIEDIKKAKHYIEMLLELKEQQYAE